MKEEKCITIVGAKENNLKDVTVRIPRDKFVVFTGLSGSGKSSLAFDTIFAEGQRRYMESLSSYARQFLGQMQKPDVDRIEGLSPAIAIDQKTTSNNPRSTVGTVTEIYDYFRLLFAHVGVPYCPHCHKPIRSQSVDTIVDSVMKLGEGAKFMILAPVVRGRKGEFVKLIEGFKKQGYVRVQIDGEMHDISEPMELDKNKKHNVSVVVDRIILKESLRSRIADSIEIALHLAEGLVLIDHMDGTQDMYSNKNACEECGYSFEEISPRLFSFNTPQGACPNCSGIGSTLEVQEHLVIPDPNLSIAESGIDVSGWRDGDVAKSYYTALAKQYNFSLRTPIKDLPRKVIDILLYGTGTEPVKVKYNLGSTTGITTNRPFEGIIPNIYRRYKESNSDKIKEELEKYMQEHVCEVCHGRRLNPQALNVFIAEKNIADVADMSVDAMIPWLEQLKLTAKEKTISQPIMKEIVARLHFLQNVGLGYLTLSRTASTLSGGEAQRIRLASQIGSGLTGVLYILDEPSIGLHPRDISKLIDSLLKLRDLGNTIIVVEHDEEVIRHADYIVDVGPKAGVHGGKIVATGTVEDIMQNEHSITGKYLSGAKAIPCPTTRRKPKDKWLTMHNVTHNNLKGIHVALPLGLFVAITGVSGSGKSSLINEVLQPYISNRIMRTKQPEGACESIEGLENVDKVVVIDQSPIGKTPRSNPATYTGLFTSIREIFASTPEAKMRGYTMSRFSFNISGGRCEVCGGDGVHKIEMHFLPDVYVTCDVCKGKRYNRETLEVLYKGKNIYEVLEMTVEEALKFFENYPSLKNKLQTLYDVGLGYIKLGQPATTLSGGEAQRVKLATELAKRPTGKTVYILDEPTTGLHTYDIDKLVSILQRLVSTGNSVFVIEHDLELLKTVDYIIDLGPEGGEKGGNIVAQGTPEELAQNKQSYTGQYLKKILEKQKKL